MIKCKNIRAYRIFTFSNHNRNLISFKQNYQRLKYLISKIYLIKVFLLSQMQTQNSPTKTPEHDKKCLKNSKASFVCADQKCTQPNPFICSDDQCPCSNIHDECKQIKIKIFLKKYDSLTTKNDCMKKQLQDKLNDCYDKLIDQLSDERDKLIKKIKDGLADWIFDTKINRAEQQTSIYSDQKLNGQNVAKMLKQHQTQTSRIGKQDTRINRVIREIQFETDKFMKSKIKELTNTIKSVVFGQIDAHSFQVNMNMLTILDLETTVKAKKIYEEFKYRAVSIKQKVQSIEKSRDRFFEIIDNFPTYFRKQKENQEYISFIFKDLLANTFNMTLKDFVNDKVIYEKVKNYIIDEDSGCWQDLEEYIEAAEKGKENVQEKDTFQRYLLQKYYLFVFYQLISLMGIRNSDPESKLKLPKHIQLKIDRVIMRLVYIYQENFNKNDYLKNEKVIQMKQGLIDLIFGASVFLGYKPKLKPEWLKMFLTPQEVKQLSIFGMGEYTQSQYIEFTINDFRREFEEFRNDEKFWQIKQFCVRDVYLAEFEQLFEQEMKKQVISEIGENLKEGKYSVYNPMTEQIEQYLDQSSLKQISY